MSIKTYGPTGDLYFDSTKYNLFQTQERTLTGSDLNSTITLNVSDVKAFALVENNSGNTFSTGVFYDWHGNYIDHPATKNYPISEIESGGQAKVSIKGVRSEMVPYMQSSTLRAFSYGVSI